MEIEDLLDKEIDLDYLLRNLDFDEHDLVRAARLQPKLMLKAARLYLQKARDKNEIEAEFDLLKSELASRIRDEVKIKSEGHLKELLVQNKRYRKMKARLDHAIKIQDAADNVREAYKQRATMIRVSTDVISAEMATGVRLQQRVNTMEKSRRDIEKKYGR